MRRCSRATFSRKTASNIRKKSFKIQGNFQLIVTNTDRYKSADVFGKEPSVKLAIFSVHWKILSSNSCVPRGWFVQDFCQLLDTSRRTVLSETNVGHLLVGSLNVIVQELAYNIRLLTHSSASHNFCWSLCGWLRYSYPLRFHETATFRCFLNR